jgi:hypothetical protein
MVGQEYDVEEVTYQALRHNYGQSVEVADPIVVTLEWVGRDEEIVTVESELVFRCGAPTASGSLCQRQVDAAGDRCWQHG